MDELQNRRQGLDSAAMGFACQNLEIPDKFVQELNAINDEISRREPNG